MSKKEVQRMSVNMNDCPSFTIWKYARDSTICHLDMLNYEIFRFYSN